MSLYRLQACFLLLALVCQTALAEDRPKIGSEVPNLKFKDIRYLQRSLSDFGEPKAVVLVFSNTTCPLVQKYWPKLKRLDAAYRDKGVQFVSVNVSVDDEIAEIAQRAIDFGVEFPFVKDVDGSCVRAVGVERTPEVVIIDAAKKLRYRGRIDDQQRVGGARPTANSDDLTAALDALLAGQEIKLAETTVDGCLITLPEPVEVKTKVTFFQDVLPIMQENCQECHRTGGGAPFSLMTREEVTSHAKMIAEVVADRRMPPWYANRQQHFLNERKLTTAERETIVAWTKTGFAAGDEAKAPPPATFADPAWEIGEPDIITTALETHKLPAEGFVEYKHIILPYVFLQDTWISGAEIKPSNSAVVHHCNMAYVPLGAKFSDENFITGRVPGGTAFTLGEGLGFKIPAGSVIGLQIHYTTTGKEETNRMQVGFRFPRYVVRQELKHVQVTTRKFEIPPGAAAHPVQSVRTLPVDATGLAMFSHMHLRGKDMTFKALFPNGDEETLLSVPNYHFDWQQNFRWQPNTKKFPKGTKIEVTAHFDNSKFNPYNPDATQAVRFGPQTVNEMMYGFFFYTADGEDLNLTIDPKTGVPVKPATPAKDAASE
ncbi:redoxin family protein [Anatilimnocola floriformis]|uniref:redoxin family protein n=1 Tax=Anatilimnocola floriformis TaxID=2948575 RepID=UPI0020C3B87C|nr:redoxin family protein [Anatilimnocola floriformis]